MRREASGLSPLEQLRYRSNRLGDDLRITNFGGGNTSSKFDLPDPLTGVPTRVLAVKGSGGDLRSITASGFAILYMDKLEALVARYRGEAHEDEMVGFYPLAAFGESRVAASIDTPLHAFLPYDHVDHLHPDWAIALAASANGRERMAEFNEKYGRKIAWVPWQRPGFELALMLRRAVEENAGCDGIILGGHGLFTWGNTQEECYLSSIRTIDQMGEFIQEHAQRSGQPQFGGTAMNSSVDRDATAAAILPHLRGIVSSNRRTIAHWDSSDDALAFANSKWAEELCGLGTSCPDHFLRTRISPMFVQWNPTTDGLPELKERIAARASKYREDYAAYYNVVRRCGLAQAARFEPVGDRHSRAWTIRLRQGQARGADHDRVLRQRDPRDGRRERARGRSAARRTLAAGPRARADETLRELPQLRGAAAARSVSHRVLGARRGEAATHAGGT